MSKLGCKVRAELVCFVRAGNVFQVKQNRLEYQMLEPNLCVLLEQVVCFKLNKIG